MILKNVLISGAVIAGSLFFSSEVIWAQQTSVKLPEIPVPKPATFELPSVVQPFGPTMGIPMSSHPGIPSPTAPNMGYTESVQRWMQMQQLMAEIQQDHLRTLYDFPEPDQNLLGIESYNKAFQSIQEMLSGQKPLSLSDAVYEVENAFYEGQLSKEVFDESLDYYADLTLRWLEEQNLNTSSNTARLYGLQKLFTDTLEISSPGMESVQMHYPFDYDFEDFWGRDDFTKQFVSKLLASGSGQCYSLPTLFLMLAERLDVDAHLAFSPNHSFVRFQDERGQWYNFETTSGYLVSDAWVMGSGYVTADAVRNKIYLQPLSTEQVVANKLADLAQGYKRKYGNAPFVKEASEASLSHFPNNIVALMVRANYQTELVNWLWNVRGKPHPSEFESDPKLGGIVAERMQMYQYIDSIGYQDMPAEAYEDWLESVETEKSKQDQRNQELRLSGRQKQ